MKSHARAPVANSPTLRRGDSGEPVRTLQEELTVDGYAADIDGIFGRDTDSVVREFQSDNQLDADGIVGPLSWAALIEAPAEESGQLEESVGTGEDVGTGETAETTTGGPTTTTTDGPTTEPVVDEAAVPTVDEYMANLGTLPRGSAMSAEQRELMFYLTTGMTIDQIRICFEHRFEHAMENTTGTWTVELARAVWRQLDTLPDDHVSENTVLTTFQAISGSGGFGPSWEAPDQVNTIQLGEDNNPNFMGHTVRHEIGHAVHADSAYMSTINTWLQNDVGFWFFQDGPTGLREWVDELGGFGAATSDEQEAFMTHLTSYVGGGASWDPGRTTFTEGLTPEDTAVYDGMPEAVREGITQSVSSWYYNYTNWASGKRGKYHLNYWYARGFYMGPVAEACVVATGDNYTAMSEKEFFANCYAEFFKEPGGFANSELWGGNLPDAVQAFFRSHILEQQPYVPPTPVGGAGPKPPAPPKPTGMAGTP